ncbi:MAG: MarR family EPS-associated transcriptional regulator [Leptospiraceae bacterium]|nr:MarR family EPS-associated transcriptional regulator [Leptospiraceae bacterium]MBI39937.1 MarR family EPS-associated transcriptional regulator [Leptospiraceae bacterium]
MSVDLPEEISHRVLGILESEPEISQRELAGRLGISLGRTNFVLKGLLERGWVKTRNFKNSKNKWAYAYFLTPEGIVEKGRVTARYIKRKVEEYESLKKEVEHLRKEYGELFEGAHQEEDISENR